MNSSKSDSQRDQGTVFIGRQPIFTSDMQTFAYELLFRSSRENWADISDGNKATAELVLNAFTEIGLERIVGELPAFINIPGEFLLSGHCYALPKERLVLEILEDVKPTPETLQALKQLRNDGYTIALDDFILAPELLPLVELADIIKVDLMLISKQQLEQHVKILQGYNVKLLAEKVENVEEFELCKKLGFEFFQGYFFGKPCIVEGKQVPSNRLTMMRLVAKLQSPSVGLAEISNVIQTEPTLALRLLRYVNSASSNLKHQVESIQHAVTITGIAKIKSIASLSALAEVGDDKPTELIETVLVRARMSELLAQKLGKENVDSYFLTGMFSGLDALLDVPMEEALEMVPIVPEVAEALRNRSGELGVVLDCVIGYEVGNWDQVHIEGIAAADIFDAWLQATEWAKISLSAM